MSKTILTDVKGFYPLIESVIGEVGFIPAAVFGVIWRYCQMTHQACEASQEKIATALGISRASVNRCIATLIDQGYIEDLTPDKIGVPHSYADTGKAGVRMTIQAGEQPVTDRTPSGEPVTDRTPTCNSQLQPPVTESYTIKDSNIASNISPGGGFRITLEENKNYEMKQEGYKNRIRAALAGNEARRLAGESDLSWCSPDYLEHARAFVKTKGINIPPILINTPDGEIKRIKQIQNQWLKEFFEIVAVYNIPVDIYQAALDQMVQNNLTCSHPGAALKIAISLLGAKTIQGKPAAGIQNPDGSYNV